MDRICAGAAEHGDCRIGGRAEEEVVVGAELELLDGDQGIASGLARVDSCFEVDQDRCLGIGVGHHVDADVAVDEVGAAPAVEDVVAAAAVDDIVAVSARQDIVAVVAD